MKKKHAQLRKYKYGYPIQQRHIDQLRKHVRHIDQGWGTQQLRPQGTRRGRNSTNYFAKKNESPKLSRNNDRRTSMVPERNSCDRCMKALKSNLPHKCHIATPCVPVLRTTHDVGCDRNNPSTQHRLSQAKCQITLLFAQTFSWPLRPRSYSRS